MPKTKLEAIQDYQDKAAKQMEVLEALAKNEAKDAHNRMPQRVSTEPVYVAVRALSELVQDLDGAIGRALREERKPSGPKPTHI